MSVQGITVNENHGTIDWKCKKREGIRYAILRAGYGAGVIDLKFREHAKGCQEAGVPMGVYWHSYAYTTEMARREAVYCAETIEEYEITYPVCYVFDYASYRYADSRLRRMTREEPGAGTMTLKLAEQFAEAFARELKKYQYRSICMVNLL